MIELKACSAEDFIYVKLLKDIQTRLKRMEEKDRIFIQKLEEELHVKPSKPAFKVLAERVKVKAEVKDQSSKEEK